jgi:hypothetical protein
MDAVVEMLESLEVQAHCSSATRQRLIELLEEDAVNE